MGIETTNCRDCTQDDLVKKKKPKDINLVYFNKSTNNVVKNRLY